MNLAEYIAKADKKPAKKKSAKKPAKKKLKVVEVAPAKLPAKARKPKIKRKPAKAVAPKESLIDSAEKPGPLIKIDQNKSIIDEIVKRLNRRPVRFDVNYNGSGNRIVSVVPIYGD